jgi:aspartate oxidase
MQRQIQLLRQLVEDSQYAVDPSLVAEAIVARAMARRAVAGTAFRNDAPVERPQVRSFRPTRQARSFRPCTAVGAEDGLLAVAPWRRR